MTHDEKLDASSDDAAPVPTLPPTAQTGDGDGLVEEKRDPEEEGEGGPGASPKRASRHERYKRTIERLRQENTQLKAGDPPAQQHAEMTQERERRIREEAAFELRAKEYFRENPTARDEIGATLSVYEPAEHVAAVILKSEIGP